MENLSKLEKFDNTLNELEKEIEKFKGAATAVKTLEGLTKTYDDILERQNEYIQILTEIEKVSRENFEQLSSEVNEDLTEIKKVNKDNFHQLRQENKDAYFDLEKTLKIKLDESRSEIKRLIEDERPKIIAELDQRTNRILKNQKGIKNSVLVLGIIILLVSIANLVIQFI